MNSIFTDIGFWLAVAFFGLVLAMLSVAIVLLIWLMHD